MRLYAHMRKDDIDETDIMATCDTGEEAGKEAEKAEKQDEDKPGNPETDDILSSGGALFSALTGKDPAVEESKPKPQKKKLTKA
jgi:hypothetical protein